MNILTVLKFPHKYLNETSDNITEIDYSIIKIINDMKETMYYNEGLGLAAIQIGVKKNLLIINTSNEEKQILVIINPKIIYHKKTHTYNEGCLSFPNIFIHVERKKKIKLKFLSLDKKYKYIKIDNLLSICIQHEIDHLNGITLYERASKIKKNMILRKIK
ncbi:MAG TPA: peptide deformylase [Candidatus Azoamicus sp. MARI]